ncbi:hypothetical protein FRC04_008481 [Tulasnella sp. 424]|nr:hypothetical protein FRC04_008481 [Tulasnella sp. 424]
MRLPSEILADGIGRLLADEDYPKSLLRLSHVSHHIRKVLLSCPWVWAGGSIKSSWHPNLVTAILEQTGGTPLQVACNFATSRGTKGSGDIVSSVQRWRSAHLSVPSLPEFPTALTRLRSLPAPALEELVVSVPHRPLPTIIPELFSGIAPNLRSVEFHNFSIHHDSLLWRGLHSLHLNIHHMWTVLSPQQMFAILAASPELHTLRLCDRMVGLAQEPEPDPSLSIELPHLSTMELAVVPSMLHVLLTNIKAPVCNRLEVTTTFADGSPQPARQVLWSLFKSAAPILARLTSDEEPPTARISVQTSALQLFARRDDWVVNCQLNCGDSGWLTPLFREAAEQCGTILPVLVDFAWIIFAEDGRNFSEILNCRSLWHATMGKRSGLALGSRRLEEIYYHQIQRSGPSKPEVLRDPKDVLNGISSDYEWQLRYDDNIEKAAADNLVPDWDWLPMRDSLKRRLHQVIAAFLANQEHLARRDLSSSDATLVESTIGGPRTPLTEQHIQPTIAISPSAIEQRPSTQHGLILPPFPRRMNDDGKVMPTKLTVSEANEEMERIFGMLDEFDEHPPFTIQRICELLTRPSIYKSLGKFLRAFERTLLVTSTADQYTTDTYAATAAQSILSPTLSDSALKLAMTPLFSPIPFLHPDLDPVTGQPIPGGRNGTSAHATPSPMMLNGDTEVDVPPSPRLGLVDELDDPSADSNHLTDHPRALSSTTNLNNPNAVRAVVDMDDMEMDDADLFGSSMFPSASGGAGFNSNGNIGGASNGGGGPLGNLSDRFVRSSTPEPEVRRALFERGREEVAANSGLDPTSPTSVPAKSSDVDTEMDVDEKAAEAKEDQPKEQ